MKKAIYPGSFDPLTNGHLDILERSLRLFDEVTILVSENKSKHLLLSVDERLTLIRKVVARKKGVTVDRWDGLIVDYAEKYQARAIIRGLRAASDFEYEFMMAAMNKNLDSKIETVFMMTSQNLFFVSSSMIKELLSYGADVGPYVPAVIVQALERKIRKVLKP